MKFHQVLIVTTAGAVLTLSGCAGVGGEGMDEAELEPLPPVEIPALTAEPQPFRTQTSFADGVLSVAVPTPDGPTRTLNTARDVDLTWGRFLPRPVQPDHSSREWILVDNHYDGRVLLYALASWNAADPADYLAAGWWLIYPPDAPFEAYEAATRGVFVDGPELDPASPARPPSGGHGHLRRRDGRPIHVQLRSGVGRAGPVHRGHGIHRAGLIDRGLRPEPPHRLPRVPGTD